MKKKHMRKYLQIDYIPNKIKYQLIKSEDCQTYDRYLINYHVSDRVVPAFLLVPKNAENAPAVLINHQHNNERNLGKSEVCGLIGNPMQAFGKMLVEEGFVVIVPDYLCFEDRRYGITGTIRNDENDERNHFVTLCNSIVSGKPLAEITIEDAMGAVSVLNALDYVDKNKIGCFGHSFGGNTTIFVTSLDNRISYGLCSGSAASYKYRIEARTGIEMSSVIPGFNKEFDVWDLIGEIAPRKFMIVCGDNDKWAKDAEEVYKKALKEYQTKKCPDNLGFRQFPGGHALTQERVNFIAEWIKMQNN